jgi:hypothetical protein
MAFGKNPRTKIPPQLSLERICPPLAPDFSSAHKRMINSVL